MEITLKRRLSSSEKVKHLLEANPGLTHKEAETNLVCYLVDCPAKGREVFWKLCLNCLHKKSIDLKLNKVQCTYVPNERRLDMFVNPYRRKKSDGKLERTDLDDQDKDLPLPTVDCPLEKEEVTIDYCADCFYQRRGEWEHPHKNRGCVGWVLCGAPSNLDQVRKQSGKPLEKKIENFKGENFRMITPWWK